MLYNIINRESVNLPGFLKKSKNVKNNTSLVFNNIQEYNGEIKPWGN